MSKQSYDLAIIGAGSAGLIAAEFAVKLGARVALLERGRIGGDCTWSGCVPSKSLLKVAKVAHDIRTASAFGIQTAPPVVDMVQVREYLRSTILQIYQGTTPEALREKGIQVLLGPASFVDPRTLIVGEQRITAKKILIATGAEPVLPPIAGLMDVPFFTYRQIFENDRLPASMIVIGGGPVGVEIAQAYQRLGAQVTIFAERLLPKEEPEASEVLLDVFVREGVKVVPEKAAAVERRGDQIMVRSATQQVVCELLLVAAGRKPTLDGLNLAAAGVLCSEQGIKVNEHLQTANSSIFAAGDIVGGEQFSHLAGWQGFQAARTALLPGSSSGSPAVMPRITFTDPEVAQVGLTRAQALAADSGAVVTTWPIARVDRAVSESDSRGFIRIIATASGRILGATIVGQRAGEAVMEIVLAMQHKLTVSKLAGIIHPYPTYNSGIQLIATEMAVHSALNGVSGKALRTASRWTL